MQLDQTDQDGVTVVRPSGRLNLVSANQLRSHIEDVVGSGSSRLVIDLSAVEFIDSSGLGSLISGLKHTRQAGGDLRIAAPGEQARVVLGLTNLDRILRPYDSVEDAVAHW